MAKTESSPSKPKNIKPVRAFVAVLCALIIIGVVLLISHHHTSHKVTKKRIDANTVYQPATSTVMITNGKFGPDHLTVKKHTVVTWGNFGPQTESVVESDNKSGPNSGPIAPDKTYSYTFTTPGTYNYYSAQQPSSKGTITVTN